MVHFDETSVKQCYQTGHFKRTKKLMENAKNQKSKCDILSNFQTMCGQTVLPDMTKIDE